MNAYLGLFLDGPDQVRALAAVLVLWTGLAGLGTLAGGRERSLEAGPLLGWAVVAAGMTLPSVVLAVPFSVTAPVLGVAALVAATAAAVRSRPLVAAGTVRVLVVAAPALLLSAALAGSQWDEFSHWLPSIRFLGENHDLPRGGNAVTGGAFPAYPYAWPLLGYLANRLAGAMVESVGPLLNLLLLLSFGLAAARMALAGAGREAAAVTGWRAAGLAVALATVLNPTFVQKVVLTSYADTSSGVAVGFGVFLGWSALNALADGDRRRARSLAWQYGLVGLVLVNVKQANLALFAITCCGVALAGLRDRRIRPGALASLAPAAVLPALVMYLAWRYHVLSALPSRAEAVFLPYESWNLDAIPQILRQMLVVLAKKGYYLGLMALAVVFAVRGLVRCEAPLDRLALVVGSLFLGYNAFLLLIFVTHFGAYDALRVASYWRYNMHLGPAAVAFAAFGAGALWRRYLADGADRSLAALAWVPMAVVLIGPFAYAKKLRFDLEPHKPHYRAVAASLVGTLPADARLMIVDPRGSGESMVITAFHLRDTVAYAGYVGAYHDARTATLRDHLDRHEPDTLLVHSVVPSVTALVGLDLGEERSHLVRRGPSGRWHVVRDWPYPPGP